MRLAVIADTHIPSRARDLPRSAWAQIEACDGLLHAGDITSAGFVEAMRAATPAWLVRGNNDPTLDALPERIEVGFDGVRIGMIHDSGPRKGRRARLRAWFPDARVVVFGHSHIPVVEDDGDLLLLNPGSPTDRRRMPTFTMAVLDTHGPTAELVDLGLERA